MKYTIEIRKRMENIAPLEFRATVEVAIPHLLGVLGEVLKSKYPLDEFSHEIFKHEEIYNNWGYDGKLKISYE